MKHVVLWILIGLFIVGRWLWHAGQLNRAECLLAFVDGFLWAVSGWYLGELLYERQPLDGTFAADRAEDADG